jgi:PHP family Zn ribbon phosphoesterase
MTDELRPDETESCVAYDATIHVCPLCGGGLSAQWASSEKRCRGCGATIRNGLVSRLEASMAAHPAKGTKRP